MRVKVERWSWKYSSTSNASGAINNYNLRKRGRVAVKNKRFEYLRGLCKRLPKDIFRMKKLSEREVEVKEIRS